MRSCIMIFTICCFLLFSSTPLFAKERGGKNAPRGNRVCAEDVNSHCSGVERNRESIHKCLEDNLEKLSDRCRRKVERKGNPTFDRGAKQGREKRSNGRRRPCAEDIKAHCSEVERNRESIHQCLEDQRDNLSESCRTWLDRKARRNANTSDS